MDSLVITGRLRNRFLEAATLLHALDPVRGEPTTHGLEIDGALQERERFLKRKFLDSFALLCAPSKGGDSVSAACMEEGQPEGTVVRLASNCGVKPAVLAQLQLIVNDLNQIACGESAREKEADILSKIVHLDISRLREYVNYIRSHQTVLPHSRLKIQEQVLKIIPDLSQSAMEAFLEWLGSMLQMDGLEATPETEIIIRYLKLAQNARHNYLEPLKALFSMEGFHWQKWSSSVFKLGRYGVASKALSQLAAEAPHLFNPMTVHAVTAPGKVPVQRQQVSLSRTLRRIAGATADQYLSRLAGIWAGSDPEQSFHQQCPDALAVHAELQLAAFYDLHPEHRPSFRFIGVSKKSCYLCDRFLAVYPQSMSTSACHQKLYLSWIPPPTSSPQVYATYKTLVLKLTQVMEATIRQELIHRLGGPRRQVPPDSTCGVSLSGLTERSTIPVVSGALLSSQTCLEPMPPQFNKRAENVHGSLEILEPMCVLPRSASSLPAATLSGPDSNMALSRDGEWATKNEIQSPFNDIVAHFKRADDVSKQDIIQISDVIDPETHTPSWAKLVKILETESDNDIGLRFKKDTDLMTLNGQIPMGNQRQLMACLQYVQNSGKLNLEILQTKARRMTMKQRKEGKLLLFGKSNDEMKDGARIFNAVLFLLYHSGLSSGGHGLSSGRHTGSVVCKTRGGFRQMGKGGGREKGDAR
ncbi:uncharacterized protein CIMG_10433 [Coccidioides immitis RS]|uniref:Uncharacterized protein n=1 Tax=Coccidioides immitis (strain RS) TaxID=246410 RepID=A0A0E1RVH7_COCIM|nr:uncharacterized protein CIMG_10433 [Coccidioides immitis RS]EAS27231.2 hypothetical protein CIMG_10433 [Coccidioides immitis RS]